MNPKHQFQIILSATFAPILVLILYVVCTMMFPSDTPQEMAQVTQVFLSALATLLAVLIAGCYVFTTFRIDIQSKQIAKQVAEKIAAKVAERGIADAQQELAKAQQELAAAKQEMMSKAQQEIRTAATEAGKKGVHQIRDALNAGIEKMKRTLEFEAKKK